MTDHVGEVVEVALDAVIEGGEADPELLVALAIHRTRRDRRSRCGYCTTNRCWYCRSLGRRPVLSIDEHREAVDAVTAQLAERIRVAVAAGEMNGRPTPPPRTASDF
jgi:hypothetical protein